MSYSNNNGTYAYSAAGWEDESDWGQNDIDTTMIDSDFIDSNYVKQTYEYCSNALRDSSERHEVVSEYAWDSDETSVCDADFEEVHSVYAWDADEICSVYAWEAEDLSDFDSEVDNTRCSWASAAKHVSEASEICSVYAWEEQEDLADWDSVADENQSGCTWESKAKNTYQLADVYPDYESDSDDEVVLYAKPGVIRNSPVLNTVKVDDKTPMKATLKNIADALGMDTSSYCKRGCCRTPECQQYPSLSESNTDFFDDVDWEDDDEEAKSEYAVDFSPKETLSFCERGCCTGPECQRYCAVPEYDTDIHAADENTEVTSTPDITKLNADALDLDSPTYCENECCVGSECQRYPSSPEDNADFLDEDSEADTSVEENLTEGDSYFGFRMRSDKLKLCNAVRSLHGHFRKIDDDGFEFTDLAGNKINVYFYNDTLHAVQQEYTTWFNFEHLPPVVANTLCAARAAINAVFGY